MHTRLNTKFLGHFKHKNHFYSRMTFNGVNELGTPLLDV